jgi:hypothetical protein
MGWPSSPRVLSRILAVFAPRPAAAQQRQAIADGRWGPAEGVGQVTDGRLAPGRQEQQQAQPGRRTEEAEQVGGLRQGRARRSGAGHGRALPGAEPGASRARAAPSTPKPRGTRESAPRGPLGVQAAAGIPPTEGQSATGRLPRQPEGPRPAVGPGSDSRRGGFSHGRPPCQRKPPRRREGSAGPHLMGPAALPPAGASVAASRPRVNEKKPRGKGEFPAGADEGSQRTSKVSIGTPAVPAPGKPSHGRTRTTAPVSPRTTATTRPLLVVIRTSPSPGSSTSRTQPASVSRAGPTGGRPRQHAAQLGSRSSCRTR